MRNSEKAAELEAVLRRLTGPTNGQYLRPWMTASSAPETARVFTVGMNPRNPFTASNFRSQDHFVHTLLNRGESLRAAYGTMTDKPSPTRRNTDAFIEILGKFGIDDVLQTNVCCYATPMSADLKRPEHIRGARQGEDLFREVVRVIKPEVLIVHGSGTARRLEKVLGGPLPSPPEGPHIPVRNYIDGVLVFVIPSLALPGYNRWKRWSSEHLHAVGLAAAQRMRPNPHLRDTFVGKTPLPQIAASFLEHLHIKVPAEDLDRRSSGHLAVAGWLIQYCFETNEKGEYLDYYASHRMTEDSHVRLYENGDVELLDELAGGYIISNPAEAERMKREHEARNRKVADELYEKGFTAANMNMALKAGGRG